MASNTLPVVAIVISGVGVMVSVVSSISARRSANAARDARHEARRPAIEAKLEDRVGGDYVLRLRNGGPIDLDELAVELVPGGPNAEPLNIVGLGLHGSHGPRVQVGPLRLGESRDLDLWRTGPHRGGVMRLRCEAARGREQWTLLVSVELPPPAPNVW